MEHNLIEISPNSLMKSLVIYHKDFNLDKIDNLDALPELPSVYAICGRVNNQAANCRYVGTTQNLRAAIRDHYSNSEPYDCLKQFMQSIKVKELIYELVTQIQEEDLHKIQEEWETKFKPVCNEKLNEVY